MKGFGDMEPEEIARPAHMGLEEARMAKERDFDERLFEAIERGGLHWTQGHFLHLTGDNDIDSKIILHRVIRADGRGPEGWNKALTEFIKSLRT